jgi:protein-L-isoaspartate(D-aspartate) O-methyltransferase
MDFAAARERLVISLRPRITDERVLEAISRVPREYFVPVEEKYQAYEDKPLPIGMGQTISQPYVIALMIQALGLTGREKVLEVGTGRGYEAAILAELARQVITVERLPELAEAARKTLGSLGYKNIRVKLAGTEIGFRDEAPYDAIVVAAGAPKVPDSLLSQLSISGRLVIPVGYRYDQCLYLITRHEDKNTVENLGGCHFVSLIGEDAWNSD